MQLLIVGTVGGVVAVILYIVSQKIIHCIWPPIPNVSLVASEEAEKAIGTITMVCPDSADGDHIPAESGHCIMCGEVLPVSLHEP